MRPLPRSLELRGAVALGVGGTVGGGVFVLIGEAAGAAGPAALVGFAIAFGAALAIALPYAELACRYPLAGGGYAFVRQVLGEPAGFLMGWGYWGAYVFLSAFVTLGFGGYLEELTGLPRIAGAAGIVVACLTLNLLGLRVSGRAQAIVVVVALAGLCGFAAWGLPDVSADRLAPFAPHGAGGVLTAALLGFLAFGGFDMVAAAGEEVDRPERNLPRAILITLALVLVVYGLVTLVAVGTMASTALGDSSAPLAEAAAGFGGDGARTLIIATALLTTAATANAVLVVTSRIAFAMARDGLLPRALAHVDRRSGAPAVALGVNAALLGAIALGGSIGLAAAAGGFLYVAHFVPPLVALAVIRRRDAGVRPAFVTPLPRLTIALAFLACAVLIVASGALGALAGGAWLAVGAAARRAARRRRPLEPARG